MKALMMDGIVPKIVDMDYDYLCYMKKKYEEKGTIQKAQYLANLIALIDEEVAAGKELTVDLIEDVVNRIIDGNKEKKKMLKEQIKALEKENAFLKDYSKRELLEEASTDVLLFI